MNYLHITLVLCLLISTSLGFAGEKNAPKEKPNVLFVFADDFSYDAVHALGNKVIQTPNIDKLAEGGVTFTQTFNMGGWNGAICTASRTMLNTGRSLWRAEKLVPNLKDPKIQSGMWSKLMKESGYDTYMTGKWHVHTPADEVYDIAKDVRGGMPNQSKARYDRVFEPGNTDWTAWDKQFGGFWEGGKHWSEVVGDNAIEFLSSAEKSDNPFFMYIAFNAPHDPRQSPKRFVDMYPVEDIDVPESFIAEPENMESMGLRKPNGSFIRDEKLAPWPRTEYSVKANMQEYYAIITHLDEQLGRIVEKLKATGKYENTYIFFTADHGLSVGKHGLIGKQSMYDHSIRPPMFVMGPDIPKKKKIDAMVYLQDIMPSTLELANADQPEYIEFNSLLPLIRGEKKRLYEQIYGAYTTKQRAVRTDRYKLILYPESKTVMMFDLKKDPKEMNDLSKKKKYTEKVKELFALLLKEQAEKDDVKADLKGTYPELM